MKKSGQITVFLSLIFLCIFSLMCGLIESARMAGARYYLKLAADSAIDSVFSEYHKGAWDKYGIFLLEIKDETEIQNSWNQYMKPYMESSGWYDMEIGSSEILNRSMITENGGSYLNQEILDYMRFGIIKDLPDGEGAADLLTGLTEASSMKSVSQLFASHTKEAIRLEKSLDEINHCLKNQKKLWQKGKEHLEEYNGREFQKSAKNLVKEMEKMSVLVSNYETLADQLKEGLSETNRKREMISKDISPQLQKAMGQETDGYESYVKEDGIRRREIEALKEKMEKQKGVISGAIERASDVGDMIDTWEGDEVLDLNQLWEPVGDVWNQVQIPLLSSSSGVKDLEKQRILEQIEKFTETGLLSLVLPEGGEVSDGIVNGDFFPSASMEKGEGDFLNPLDRIIFEEYCSRFLTNFSSEETKEFQYEMEYLLSGEMSDEDNLENVVTKLIGIREGMNLIHILTDSEKRQEANALASMITGAAGLLPLTGIISFFIMTVWALGESIVDVKLLLEGKKVGFVKSKETWNLTLSDLLEFGGTKKIPGSKGEDKGIDYIGYLKLLLLLGDQTVQSYRLMDMIQWNLCKDQGDFRMESCIYQCEIKGNIKTKHMFLGGNAPFYLLDVKTEKAY